MYHQPVLLRECIEELVLKPYGVYVDVTFGGGGHSREILKKLNEDGRLIGFDQDEDAKENVPEDDRLVFVHANYRHLKRYLKLHKIIKVDGILADFGVSSWQLDQAERGFSIRFDAPLDMRMDKQGALTAYDVVNHYPFQKMVEVFSHYGEIFNSKTLARKIEEKRAIKPITTTGELVELSKTLSKGNESKYMAQVFQAIRIEVNDELNAIKEFLVQSGEILVKGGRLVVMSYHSLEDRLVKNYIKTGTFDGNPDTDLYGNYEKPFKPVTKKALEASAAEIKENPRARSAKLRIAEKI